jgi:hypothetical protein
MICLSGALSYATKGILSHLFQYKLRSHLQHLFTESCVCIILSSSTISFSLGHREDKCYLGLFVYQGLVHSTKHELEVEVAPECCEVLYNQLTYSTWSVCAIWYVYVSKKQRARADGHSSSSNVFVEACCTYLAGKYVMSRSCSR